MAVQPARTAWLAIAAHLNARATALAVAGDRQQAAQLRMSADVLLREAPPAKARTEPTRREAKKATTAKRKQRPVRDAQYRAVLGIEPGQALPPTVGTANSAGAARGGRGASRRGRGSHK